MTSVDQAAEVGMAIPEKVTKVASSLPLPDIPHPNPSVLQAADHSAVDTKLMGVRKDLAAVGKAEVLDPENEEERKKREQTPPLIGLDFTPVSVTTYNEPGSVPRPEAPPTIVTLPHAEAALPAVKPPVIDGTVLSAVSKPAALEPMTKPIQDVASAAVTGIKNVASALGSVVKK